VLVDPGGTLTIDSVAFGKASLLFTNSKSDEMNFGHTSAVIWVKIAVDGATMPGSRTVNQRFDWIISPDYPLISRVSVFVPSADGKFSEMKSGIAHPMNERILRGRLIAFPFQLNAGEHKTLFMRFESIFSLPLSLRIWRPSAFAANESNKNLIFGLFYGALFIMAFYNLFLFFSVRDLSYLYYFLFAATVGWYQTVIDGLSARFIFPDSVWFNAHYVLTSIGLSGIFGMLFVREFLQIQKYSLVLYNLYKIFLGIGIFYVAISVPFFLRMAGTMNSLMWVGFMILNVISGIYALYKGNKNARVYLVATLIFIVGSFLRLFRVMGMETESTLTESMMQIGIILEMTLLSFALGNRINTIMEDEEKEKALIRTRIAGDIHDEIGSNLSSISMSSQMMLRSPRLDDGERSKLIEIAVTAKESAEAIRDIAWFIDPQHDRMADLITKMREAAARMLMKTQHEFTVADEMKIKLPNLQVRRNIYLIFKELLHNVVKHAEAKKVCIDIKNEAGCFVLTFHDDGVGFDERHAHNGHGMKSLRARAQKIEADLLFTTSPGQGTTAKLSVPV